MVVMASGDRPHSAAYRGYSGVGALDPAKKDTVIDASRKKAAFGARVAPLVAVAVVPVAKGPGCMSLSVNQTRSVCRLHHTDLSVIVNSMNAKAASPRQSARERLLAAADELFYEGGINLVGIDRIIEHAGVAKASLYDCFGSKEELIRCYLEARSAARQQRIRERIANHDSPVAKILSIFDLLEEITSQPNFRGCAFLRAGADAGADGKVKQACNESRAFLRNLLIDLAREAGARNPEQLGPPTGAAVRWGHGRRSGRR